MVAAMGLTPGKISCQRFVTLCRVPIRAVAAAVVRPFILPLEADMTGITSEPVGEPPIATTETFTEPTPKSLREWARWAIPAGALVLGLAIGGGSVGALMSDPTQTEEYQALKQDLEDAEGEISDLSDTAREAASASRKAQDEAAQRRVELDQREQTLAAREKAVTAVEQQIAANSIEQGTWTVGRDVTPGTYRTAQPVTGDCYWEITRSGTNGSDIIENDIVEGGFPTVQLSDGQDFTNNRCGTFVKQ
jgi:hypothetical protein